MAKKAKQLSFETIRDLVKAALNEGRATDEYGYVLKRAWIKDLYPDHVIYQDDMVEEGAKGIFKRTYSVDVATLVVTLGDPEQVVEVTTYEPANFTADLTTFSAAGESVTYTGKVFECGSYPDKGFSLSETEADAVISGFKPVPNDLEHKSTVLSGQLGGLQKLWRQGTEIFGSITVPKWLHDATGGGPLKTSLAFDAGTKQVVGNALVLNPRIPDATLVAAFNESRHTPPQTAPKEVRMNPLDRLTQSLKAFFTSGKTPSDDELQAVVAEFAKTAPVPTPSPTNQPTETEKALQARLDAMQAGQIAQSAAQFSAAALADGRITPAQKGHLQTLFAQAVKADTPSGAIEFSADGSIVEGESLKALKEFVAGIPQTVKPLSEFGLLGQPDGKVPDYAPISIDLGTGKPKEGN